MKEESDFKVERGESCFYLCGFYTSIEYENLKIECGSVAFLFLGLGIEKLIMGKREEASA